MAKQNGPGGFIAVLPDEVVEIPQDGGKSWLTLFYCLPKELAGKWKPALDLPRCPYEVLRTDKYDSIICDDMFKLLVWDCYSWSAWQLSYSIILYIRMEFEKNGLSFQALYDVPPGVEVPWLTYRQFGNLIGNITDLVIEKQNWQPVIDAIWENRGVEDYDARSSAVKTDFMRKWHHDRSGSSLSLDEITEDEIFSAAGSRGEFEQNVLSQMQINAFAEGCISDRDREILRLRMEGYTEQEIADRVGYQTASAVHKRISRIASAYENFVTAEYTKYYK